MKKLLILMIALCVVLACTEEEETQFNGEGSVGIRLNWIKSGKGNHQTATPPPGLVEMEVEISGDGIDPAIVENFSGTDLEDSSGVISGVPAGTNRTVRVRGKNDADEIIAEGTESDVTISKNQTNVVSISISLQGSWILVDQDNLSFGNVPTGIGEAIQSIYIENPGDQQLEITDVIFPEGFHTEEANPPIYINPDEVMEVKIVFVPTENKGYGGNLEIQSDAKNKPVYPISLSGTGTDEPYITVMPHELNYGDVNISEPPKIDSLFIENIGTKSLTIENIYFSSPAFFSNPEIPPEIELIPGESARLDVFFAPQNAGNYNDTLFIESNSYESDLFMVSVSGVGKEGSMIATEPENEIDFGAHPVGEPSYPYDIMIYNMGDEELEITDLFFDGDSDNFSTDFQTPSFIPKGDSLPLPIVFYPDTEQEYNCDLHIYSNAQNQPDKVIYLHGIGASGPFISVMPYFIHFGDVEVDTESEPQNIIVENDGDEELEITNLDFSDPDIFYSPEQLPIHIQPGYSEPINIIFHPTEEMTYDETVSIMHNAANEINPISLDGTGIPPAIPEGGVAYYDWHTGSGNTLYDNWGTNHGTIEDDDTHWSNDYPTFGTSGNDGSPHSGDFDGVDDYVDLGDLEIWDFQGDFTVCAWINHDVYSGNSVIDAILDNREDPPGTYSFGWRFLVGDSGINDINEGELAFRIHYAEGGTDEIITSSKVITAGIWYHVTFTKNGNTGYIYVNGQEEINGLMNHNPLASDNPLNIGREPFEGKYHFEGKIDEVKIFDRALTEQEIENLYNYGSVYGR